MDEPKRIDRYPGMRSFEQEEEDLFFGRDQEQADLFALVKVSQLTLIFSKSGVGKTSMINAGLKPLLEAEAFLPIPIRLQSTAATPVQIVEKALEKFVEKSKIRAFHPKAKPQLWHWLRAADFKGKIPVLIFDQFEEFSAHDAAAREEFIDQLADLVQERLPKQVEEQFYNLPLDRRSDDDMAWYVPAAVKIIIAIRSDRMSDLDNEMSVKIPSALRDRYHLRPFAWEQAQRAIEEPAKKRGNYASQPFTYAPETLEIIERNLKGKTADEIEPFQLQILCQEIERQVKEKDEEKLVITPDFLGGKEGVQLMLNNYYEKQIAALGSEQEQMAVRRLLEDELIADKKRVGVAADKVKNIINSEELREKLLQTRLVRESDTHLGKVYELSHDNLVGPVLVAKAKREEVEKRREKERKITAWAGLSLLMTALTTLLLSLYLRAEEEKNRAEEQREKAEKLANELATVRDSIEINNDSLADANLKLKELTAQLENSRAYIQQRSREERNRLSNEKAFQIVENYVNLGLSAMGKSQHESAINHFKNALNNIPKGYPNDKLNDIKYALARSYENQGEFLRKQKKNKEALEYYREALKSLPPENISSRRRIEDRIKKLK